MHTDVAILSVHADVAPQSQCNEVHQVLLTVAMPSIHVLGRKRLMPQERPYMFTAAPWTSAATVAPNSEAAASAHECVASV